MPSSTPERRARWTLDEQIAIKFLKDRGYALNRNWSWTKPNPDHEVSELEGDAIAYLIEEWDFDGIQK